MLNVTDILMHMCNLQPYYQVLLFEVKAHFYYILPPMSMLIWVRRFDLKSGEGIQNVLIIYFLNVHDILLDDNSNVEHF